MLNLFCFKANFIYRFSYSDWNLKFIMQKVLNRLGDNIQPSYLIDLKRLIMQPLFKQII